MSFSVPGRISIASIACALLLSLPANAQQPLPRLQLEPEVGTGHTEKTLAVAKTFMISTANPLASEAGREMLRAGGSAVDAAIAAQLVLGLVEPQSSGLGGGAFVLHWSPSGKALTAYDGRETAPASARPDRFLKEGKPISFDAAVHSGLSVGTPGLPRLLEHMHKAHGKLPWPKLFEPALRLARDGFPISNRLYFMLRWFGDAGLSPAAKRHFFDGNGSPLPIGYVFKNTDYATTLEKLASGGADAFYSGPIADSIVAAVRNAGNAAGDLSPADLAAYKVVERAPLCIDYRKHKICGMPAPSSGGVAVAQTLKLVERFDLGRTSADAMATPAMHLVLEAERLAYADRDRYLADPAFTPVPSALLDNGYLSARSALINAATVMPRADAGQPPGVAKQAFGNDFTRENVGTSHLSVVDADDNAVAMTTTIEGPFGSGLYASGFLLNNELTDFSFRPVDAEGLPVANRVEGGKRPRSSMAPTIVFDEKGDFSAALGSPGGGRIIVFVVKALLGMIDWQLDAQAAVDLPNFGNTGHGTELEYGWSTLWKALLLTSYGHTVTPDLMNSGLHVVARRHGRLEGAADPRREGRALGD